MTAARRNVSLLDILRQLDLKIPKVREGPFFPSFLEPRKMTEKAIVSVVQEAYVHGVSTRKADDLVRAIGKERHRQIHSADPLESLNKEIKRRADVVGIFPNDGSVLRLLGSVMTEQNDEWIVLRRYFSRESMSKLLPSADAMIALSVIG